MELFLYDFILPVLVLAAAVVGVEDEISLAHSVYLEMVVEKGDHHAHGLIDEVVDLLNRVSNLWLCVASVFTHLTRDSLTTNPKKEALSGRQKEDGSRLLRVIRVMDLCIN